MQECLPGEAGKACVKFQPLMTLGGCVYMPSPREGQSALKAREEAAGKGTGRGCTPTLSNTPV